MVSKSVAMMTKCCIDVAMSKKYKVEMSHQLQFVWVFERSRIQRSYSVSRAVSLRGSGVRLSVSVRATLIAPMGSSFYHVTDAGKMEHQNLNYNFSSSVIGPFNSFKDSEI